MLLFRDKLIRTLNYRKTEFVVFQNAILVVGCNVRIRQLIITQHTQNIFGFSVRICENF